MPLDYSAVIQLNLALSAAISDTVQKVQNCRICHSIGFLNFQDTGVLKTFDKGCLVQLICNGLLFCHSLQSQSDRLEDRHGRLCLFHVAQTYGTYPWRECSLHVDLFQACTAGEDSVGNAEESCKLLGSRRLTGSGIPFESEIPHSRALISYLCQGKRLFHRLLPVKVNDVSHGMIFLTKPVAPIELLRCAFFLCGS